MSDDKVCGLCGARVDPAEVESHTSEHRATNFDPGWKVPTDHAILAGPDGRVELAYYPNDDAFEEYVKEALPDLQGKGAGRLGWQLFAPGGWRIRQDWVRDAITYPEQNELWVRLSFRLYHNGLPRPIWKLIHYLSRTSPKQLSPIIIWVLYHMVGYSPVWMDIRTTSGHIAPDISDSEYDAGTRIEQEERKRAEEAIPSVARGRTRRGDSGYLGVDLYKRTGRWRSRIRVNGARLELGYFATPERAAKAYDQAARFHLGLDAVVNFPASREA